MTQATYASRAGAAIRKVRAALKAGTLHKQPCLVCGDPKVEAHHPRGYDDDHALDVEWLCRQHHDRVHHPALFTLPEAAKSLGLSSSTLRHQIRSGVLEARKAGRDWYVTAEEVERYRQQHRRNDR